MHKLRLRVDPADPPARQFTTRWLTFCKNQVVTVGTDVRNVLRQQTRQVFKSTRMPTTWRGEVYPKGDRLAYNPATLVYSRVPEVIDAHERGTPFRARARRYMAIAIDPGNWQFDTDSLRGSARVVDRRVLQSVLRPNKANSGEMRYVTVRRRSSPEQLRQQGWQFKAVRMRSGALLLFGSNAKTTNKIPKVPRSIAGRHGFKPIKHRGTGLTWIPLFWLVRQVEFKKTFDLPVLAHKAETALALAISRATP